LHWRINGPVGVMALAKAIMKEAKSDEEKVFLLAEIALDISKVSITSKENSLDEREIKEALKGAINQLKEFQGDINTRIESNLKSYVSSAMKKAYHEL
jgi:fumarylacetoacetate (FAA) hydrolase family protein